MYSVLLLSIAAFLVCYALTPLIRDLCLHFGCVDRPDAARKLHSRAVPRVGGVAIALSYVAAFGILLAAGTSSGSIVAHHLGQAGWLLPAVATVFLTGLADDLAGLKPWQKLAGQGAAAMMAYGAGVRIMGVAGLETSDWWWSFPLTIAWLVGCTNAFNLIDGVDGLASGIGLCATLTTFLVALLNGDITLALATAPLAGALAAFLRYNVNPASIFLGDCGSLFIGFLLGCFGVLWGQKSATLLGMAAPVMVLAVPLADTALAIARRFLRGKPVFGADRGHIHHRLLDRGFTPRRVALLMCGFGVLAAALSVMQTLAGRRYAQVILIGFCALAALAVRRLGYVEFRVARSVVLGGEMRKLVSDRIRLDPLRAALEASPTPADCWNLLRESAPVFGLEAIRLVLCGEGFHASAAADRWTIHVPVGGTDHLVFARLPNSGVSPASLAVFADAVAETLTGRRDHLRPSQSLDPDLVALARQLSVSQANPQLH